MSERIFPLHYQPIWGWRGILVGDGYLLGGRSVVEGPIHRETHGAERWIKEVAQRNKDAHRPVSASRLVWYDDRALYKTYRIALHLGEGELGRRQAEYMLKELGEMEHSWGDWVTLPGAFPSLDAAQTAAITVARIHIDRLP